VSVVFERRALIGVPARVGRVAKPTGMHAKSGTRKRRNSRTRSEGVVVSSGPFRCRRGFSMDRPHLGAGSLCYRQATGQRHVLSELADEPSVWLEFWFIRFPLSCQDIHRVELDGDRSRVIAEFF